MAELELTPKERQALKGRAHRLDPVVLLGSQGLTDAVVREIDRALNAHELIKVRVPGDDRAEREALFADVATRLGAARVQAIGKLLVFFRPAPPPAPPADARSAKAPARGPRPANSAGKAQRPQPGRDDVRRATPRTSAPRRGAGRTR